MTTESPDATVTAVVQAEEERCAVIATNDWVALDAILGEDYTYTHSNGKTENKAEWMAGIANRPRTIVRENLTVRPLGDIALLSGRLLMNVRPLDGPPLDVDLDCLQVWARRDGSWKLIAHHGVRNVAPTP